MITQNIFHLTFVYEWNKNTFRPQAKYRIHKKSNDLFHINLEMRVISKRNSDLHSNPINILNIGTVHTDCVS